MGNFGFRQPFLAQLRKSWRSGDIWNPRTIPWTTTPGIQTKKEAGDVQVSPNLLTSQKLWPKKPSKLFLTFLLTVIILQSSLDWLIVKKHFQLTIWVDLWLVIWPRFEHFRREIHSIFTQITFWFWLGKQTWERVGLPFRFKLQTSPCLFPWSEGECFKATSNNRLTMET